jgi:hypothetical protein
MIGQLSVFLISFLPVASGTLTLPWSLTNEDNRLQEIEHQIDLIHDHARRETEMIRTVDPGAAEVKADAPELRAYVKAQESLVLKIWDATGQLPSRVVPDNSANRPHLFHSVLGVDLEKALGLSTLRAAVEPVGL